MPEPMVTIWDRPKPAHLVGESAEHPPLLLTDLPPGMAWAVRSLRRAW